MKQQAMSEADYARKVVELERLLNDPDVPMEPSRVWTLLAEIKHASFDGATATSVGGE